MSTVWLTIITIVLWGVASFCYKISNTHINPIIAALISTPLYVGIDIIAWFIKKPAFQLNVTGVTFALFGAALMSGGSLAFGFLCQKGDAGEVTSSTALYPAITLLCSVFFLKEDLSPKKIIGIGLALVSVYLLSKK